MAYPRVHPIIASLFHLPFEPGSFAHVHSQGVIHHTYSTKAAFEAISAFTRPGGTLFVWVYAQEDSLVVPGFRGIIVERLLASIAPHWKTGSQPDAGSYSECCDVDADRGRVPRREASGSAVGRMALRQHASRLAGCFYASIRASARFQ